MSGQKDTTLDPFLGLPPSQSNFECIATSQDVRDRGSIFVANIYAAASVKEAHAVHAHVKNVVHGSKPATHEVAAWRCMVLKPGKSGLGGPDDFELRTGSVDDAEQHAGAKALKVMQEESTIDAVVIVSRWYGGVMLGPIRFAHFETCAREVCRTFRLKDDMDSLIATLMSLDDILASLRADLAKSTASTSDAAPTTKKAPNYDSLKESLDIGRAKRLVTLGSRFPLRRPQPAPHCPPVDLGWVGSTPMSSSTSRHAFKAACAVCTAACYGCMTNDIQSGLTGGQY